MCLFASPHSAHSEWAVSVFVPDVVIDVNACSTKTIYAHMIPDAHFGAARLPIGQELDSLRLPHAAQKLHHFDDRRWGFALGEPSLLFLKRGRLADSKMRCQGSRSRGFTDTLVLS